MIDGGVRFGGALVGKGEFEIRGRGSVHRGAENFDAGLHRATFVAHRHAEPAAGEIVCGQFFRRLCGDGAPIQPEMRGDGDIVVEEARLFEKGVRHEETGEAGDMAEVLIGGAVEKVDGDADLAAFVIAGRNPEIDLARVAEDGGVELVLNAELDVDGFGGGGGAVAQAASIVAVSTRNRSLIAGLVEGPKVSLSSSISACGAG